MIPDTSSLFIDGSRQVYEIVCLANSNSDPVVVIKSKKLGSLNLVVTLEDFQNRFVKYIY